MSILDKIMKYEDGSMSDYETVLFFSELIKTGTIRCLQGSYQRQASALEQAGVLTLTGAVNHDKLKELGIYE